MKKIVIAKRESVRQSFVMADCEALDCKAQGAYGADGCDMTICLEAEARADILVVVGQKSTKEQHIVAHLGRSSVLKLITLDVECADFERHTEIYLDGENAQCELSGVFVTTATERCANYIEMKHLASDCVSTQTFRGVASGSSRGKFRGHIYVAPQAQDTSSEQTNYNIVFSDGAVIETQPVLEIYADRVKCNHGATVGREDPMELFYLRQRGIAPAAARAMLTEGFCRSALPVEGFDQKTQDLIQELLMRKLSSL
ncbi:MAG: SufD family Fe-S cluster assembly protein [Mucinivorans sp.]